MAFNIKKYIIENNNRQNILTEAGLISEKDIVFSKISDNDKKILNVIALVAKIRMTQHDREILYSILRKIRLRSGGK